MDWQKFLDETIQSTGVYHKEASELFTAFAAMGKAAKKSDALDEKTKEEKVAKYTAMSKVWPKKATGVIDGEKVSKKKLTSSGGTRKGSEFGRDSKLDGHQGQYTHSK